MKRAALYARFSSDLQKDRSIDDQLHACQSVAKRENLKVVASFVDRAKSGASMFERDGLRELMNAAKAKQFDVVVVEALDRLSRDQEDMAGIFKRLTFWDIDILTLNEGLATEIHVGVRSIVSSLFLKDLGNKVRRGIDGVARDGKIPGSLAFGYRLVAGKPGEREIDPDQANTVRRIFKEFAAGVSPRAIAADLTRDKIASPNGTSVWNMQTIVNKANGIKRGIIGNQLYIGQLVWNTQRVSKDPETGKHIAKRGPEANVIRTAVPHLRIIDQPLWDAAQKIRDQRSAPTKAHERKVVARTQTMLTGLLRCESCGGLMHLSGRDDAGPRVKCSAAAANNTCQNTRSFNLAQLEQTVISGLHAMLADPERLARFEKGFMSQIEKRKPDDSELRETEKRLTHVSAQIDRVVNAIATMDTPVKQLTDKLDQLEADRAGLAERVRLLHAESAVIKLHPTAVKAYRQKLVQLLRSMTGTVATPEASAAFRMLFDSIVVHRTPKRMPYEVTPYARVGGALDANLSPPKRTSAQMLEEAGVSYCDNANKAKPLLAVQQYKVVCLGRWRQAA